MPRWKFYLRYSWLWFKTQANYAIFATLCVAASVAIVVMIESVNATGNDAIVQNVKQINGGDISLLPLSEPLKTNQLAHLSALEEQGRIESFTSTLWGRVSAVSPASERTSILVARGIDPTRYPLYGRVAAIIPEGRDLASLLQNPEDVVLSKNAFDRLDLQIGDTLELRVIGGNVIQGKVRGVVRLDGETAEDMAVFGYAFMTLPQARTLLTYKAEELDRIYVRVSAATELNQVTTRLKEAFPATQIRTYRDVLAERQSNLETWSRTLSVFGMLAILIGSLGIIDTTIVSVRRKSAELAILKTLGASDNQARNIILTEALLLGAVGSFIGVIVGIGVSLFLNSLLSQVLSLPIVWRLRPEPIVLGGSLGIGLSIIFTYLPAQYVSRLSPNLILRQTYRGAGSHLRLWSSKQLLVIAGAAGVVVSLLMRSSSGFYFTGAAMLGLIGLSWIISKVVSLVPQPPRGWGGYMLRIALQHLRSQTQRVSLVLVALIVSVAALGTVLFLGDNVKQAFRQSARRDADYDLVVLAPDERQDEVTTVLAASEGIEGIVSAQVERVTPVRVNGRDITVALDAALNNPDVAPLLTNMTIEGIPLETGWGNRRIVEGQELTNLNDSALPTLTMLQPIAQALQVTVGDEVTLSSRNQETTYQVVGLTSKPLFVTSQFNTAIANLDGQRDNVVTLYYVQTDKGNGVIQIAEQARRQLPGTIVLEIRDLLAGVDQLIDQQILFLSATAVLATLVGMLIIANGVALAMLEERRAWAIMKSIGARRSHLLKVILWEYGLIGLAGGIAGLFLAATASFIVIRVLFSFPAQFPLFEMVSLLILTVLVSLMAAWLAARRAVEEAPLPILRNE